MYSDTGHMLMVDAAAGVTSCDDSNFSCVNRADHIKCN